MIRTLQYQDQLQEVRQLAIMEEEKEPERKGYQATDGNCQHTYVRHTRLQTNQSEV